MRYIKWIMISIIISMMMEILLTGCYQRNEGVMNSIEEHEEIVFKLNYLHEEHDLDTQWDEKEMGRLEMNMNYIPLEDVQTDLMHEVVGEVLLPQWSRPIVEKVSDGFVVVDLPTMDEDDNNQPVLYKLDLSGRLLWQREYDIKLEGGTLDNLLIYSDGRILFSISHWPEISMGVPGNQQTHIIQCDADGSMIWEKEYDDFIGSRFKYMFLTKEEQIMCIGEWYAENGIQTYEYTDSDIVITLLDDQGEMIKEISYGGLDNEYCQGAVYQQDMGLVFSGWSLSKDGELVTRNYNSHTLDYVACVDSCLDIQWVHHPEKEERYYYDQVQIRDNRIYLVGYKWLKDGQNLRDIFIEQLDKSGNNLYKTYENNCMMGKVEQTIFENGNRVLIYGGVNTGVMVLYNSSGKIIKRLEDLAYSTDAIIASRDGGFVVKVIREITGLPQPLYVSSILFDVEVIMIKYDADLNLVWRKTYDSYKDDVKVDWVNVYP